jgi:murein DD-endopeptidase MepM/ murein hydrolase activator NlpD
MKPSDLSGRARWAAAGRRLLLPLLLGGLVVAAPLPAPAQSSDVEQELSRIKAVINDAETDAHRNAEALAAVERQLAQGEQLLARAESDRVEAVAEIRQARAQAQEAGAQVLELEREIGARARSMYIRGGLGEVAAITGATEPEAMLERIEQLNALARRDNERLPELQLAVESTQEALTRIEQAERRRLQAIQEANRRRGELEQIREVRQETQAKLEVRIEEYRENLAEILRDSQEIRARLSGRGDTGPTGKLRLPVQGCERTSPFGFRWGRPHEGIDFGCDTGTPVRAVADGIVFEAGWEGAYGEMVLIDHGTYVTAYAHNSEIQVELGQEVKAGQVIALSGNTGRSTGPHVHFEVRVNGEPRDPAQFLG